MKTKLLFFFVGLGLIFTVSCTKYPPASDRLLEDMAVITQYDTRVSFDNYHTYSLATKIIKITDKDTTEMQGNTVTMILDQIDNNMKTRGFMPIITPGKPDFGIQVVYYENTYVYTYYYDYWGYPYYGWYYPYYPVYYSSYTAGLLNIDLVDLKNADPASQKLYIRWNAYIRGLMTGNHTNSDITGSIDQAFTQTPQLKTTAN